MRKKSPDEKFAVVSTALPPPMVKDIEEIAAATKRTKSDVVRLLIEQGLGPMKKKISRRGAGPIIAAAIALSAAGGAGTAKAQVLPLFPSPVPASESEGEGCRRVPSSPPLFSRRRRQRRAA